MGSSASALKTTGSLKEDTTMLCANCSSSLNLFNRKKCTFCQQHFCSKCLISQFTLSRIPKICQKCFKLTSGKFTRNDLEVYSVKELRQFLSRSNIPLDNCFEKSDLVALVLMNTPQCGNHEDLEHEKHVQLLRERMEEEMMSTSHSEVNGHAFRGPQNTEVTSTGMDPDDSTLHSSASLHEVVDVPPSDFSEPNLNAEQETTPTHSQQISEGNASDSPKAENFRLQVEPQFKDPVKLEDIKEASQVDFLNVRQMKELLTRNFVNYKGCCERNELSDMVVNLWREHSRNISTEHVNNPQRDDMCKICMDQMIDCVLLECGHMVACKNCGRQLAECPICRKYVSRVVHVFRA